MLTVISVKGAAHADSKAGRSVRWKQARPQDHSCQRFQPRFVPSFANGATPDDHNLVLWRWGSDLPHKVMVYDPTGKLPKNQMYWT